MKAVLKVVSLQAGQKIDKSDPAKPKVIPTVHLRATNPELGLVLNIQNGDSKLAEGLSIGSDFPITYGK